MKVATEDKETMTQTFLSRIKEKTSRVKSEEVGKPSSGALPALKYLPDDNEGWVTFEDPILFVYAGQGPYVGRDYMAFPVSEPDDGLIDISVMPVTSRGDILSAIDGAEKGSNFWFPSVSGLVIRHRDHY
jgi:sphingosine kinase